MGCTAAPGGLSPISRCACHLIGGQREGPHRGTEVPPGAARGHHRADGSHRGAVGKHQGQPGPSPPQPRGPGSALAAAPARPAVAAALAATPAGHPLAAALASVQQWSMDALSNGWVDGAQLRAVLDAVSPPPPRLRPMALRAAASCPAARPSGPRAGCGLASKNCTGARGGATPSWRGRRWPVGLGRPIGEATAAPTGSAGEVDDDEDDDELAAKAP